MVFLTIHELSVEFDIPARVLRYRFHQLRKETKLVEGVDYRQDDFVDEQHFNWKINPVSFMRETGLKPVTKTAPFVSEADNQKPPLVTTTVIQPEKSRIQSSGSVTHSDTGSSDLTSQRPSQGADLTEFFVNGQRVTPGKGTFKTDLRGLTRLAGAVECMLSAP